MLSFEPWRVRQHPTWTRFLGTKELSFLGSPPGKSSLRGEDAPTFLGQAGPEKESRCSLPDLESLRFPTRYYITRAKLVSKIAKYPHVVSRRRGGALRVTCRCFLGLFGPLVPVLEMRVLWELGGGCTRMERGKGCLCKRQELGLARGRRT